MLDQDIWHSKSIELNLNLLWMNCKSNINTMSIDFECQISWSSIYKAKKVASRRLFRPVINREILLGAREYSWDLQGPPKKNLRKISSGAQSLESFTCNWCILPQNFTYMKFLGFLSPFSGIRFFGPGIRCPGAWNAMGSARKTLTETLNP